MVALPDLDPLDAAYLFPTAWANVCWRGRWWQPRHVALMEDEILSALDVGYDLLIETPPRHKKSVTVSRALPGWFMGRFPDLEVMHASRAVNQGAKWGSRIRSDLSTYGPDVFGVQVSADSRAKAEFGIEDVNGRRRDGRFFACGVAGGVHGEGFNLLVTDDLVKGTEAVRSDVQLEALEEFCLVDLETRRNSGGRHIGIQTRWSESDPHGIWTSAFPNRYRTLKLRAICEHDPDWPDPMERKIGEALWPEKYPIERLLEIRDGGEGGLGMPAGHWSALYQQDPTPLEGGIFKRLWWNDKRYRFLDGSYDLDGYRVPSEHLTKFAVVDMAFTEKKHSDWTVIGVFGVTPEPWPNRMLLLDVRRDRMTAPDLIPAVQAACADWGARLVFVERAGQQIGQIDYMRRAGIMVKTVGRSESDDVQISGDKHAPWHEASPYVKAGRLWVPRHADWLSGWEREMLVAPNGSFDDQVDVTAWAVHAAHHVATHGGVRSSDYESTARTNAAARRGRWAGLVGKHPRDLQ